MIGKTISHYKIIEKLGEGGMGVVYKAQDTKLDRFVALKFLPPALTTDPEAKERFIHEAKAASALDHNNICAIHEIDETDNGQIFIVMACYEGEILKDKIERGPLKLDEAVDIAIQIAKGLEKAHNKEIVHRDIKPGNIFITHDGVVKIVDFGLAKLKGQVKLTKEGTTLGTAAYMSPENARGSEVDQRTDIWSLGIVLYEMLTGQLPFRGAYEQAVTYSILNEEPEPVTALRTGIPMELERIINKCLSKEPERRYQQIQEVIVDLKEIRETQSVKTKTVTQRIPSRKRNVSLIAATGIVFIFVVLAGIYFFTKQDDVIDSIAVLPLGNMMGEDQEYFVDGMHEAIIAELSKIEALRTIGRTSVLGYKETTKSISEISDELDVKAVLEGSTIRFGDTVRITVQLIATRPERHIYTQTFDRELKKQLALYTDVASAVAHGINVTLTPEEEARFEVVPSEVNPEAYDLYLRGWQQRLLETRESISRAVDYLEQAVELDPNFALAWANLSAVYGIATVRMGLIDRSEAVSRSWDAVDRALALDPDLVEAHISKGILISYTDMDNMTTTAQIAEAEAAFHRGLALNPGLVDARYEYGMFLMRRARFNEALAEFRLAQDLDPVNPFPPYGSRTVYGFARQYDKALEYARLQDELQGRPPTDYSGFERDILMQQGRYEEAAAMAEEAGDLWDQLRAEWALGNREKVYAIRDSLVAIGELSQQEQEDYWWYARFYGLVGEKEQALSLLETADEADSFTYGRRVNLLILPVFDSLRAEPRFKALFQKVGLLEVFEENGQLIQPLDETLEAYNAPGSR